MTALLQTSCHDWHAAHGGRMVDFAGWDMPVQYTSISAEHHAVRKAAGLFDIAHMGRLRFDGSDAFRFLDQLVTNDVRQLDVGQVQYALILNEAGGILDDVLVYRFSDFYLMVVNASNREKIVAWIDAQLDGSELDCQYQDLTTEQFMFALQGPLAESVLSPLCDIDLKQIGYYWAAGARVLDASAIVSRTGYTGEDGFEVILPASHGVELWERLIADISKQGGCAAGLGCRDTLRLEAAMPLYGHELNEQMDPLTAGLKFAVKLKKQDFIGREALLKIQEKAGRPRRVGLELDGKRIAREHTSLFVGDEAIGEVTSGTFSPTFEKSIAMAYVKPQFATVGTRMEVDIRGKREAATVVKLPFYRRG